MISPRPTSINVAVPWDEFKAKLWQQIHRTYGSAKLDLPVPRMAEDGQMIFDWTEAA